MPRGITHALERAFWPRYNYRIAVKDIGEPATTGGPKSARGGMLRGTMVDSQVRAFVNNGKAPTHPYARKLLKALELAGLKPFSAQQRVKDEVSGFFTGVDLICKRGETFVVVEIKCGFCRHGVYDAACGKMRGCLSDLDDSPRFQHAVQTTVTRYLFMETFATTVPPEAIVARVSDDGVYFHPVPPHILARAKHIVGAISTLPHAKKKAAKRFKKK